MPRRPELLAFFDELAADGSLAWEPYLQALDARTASGAVAVLPAFDRRLPGESPTFWSLGSSHLAALLSPPESGTGLLVRRDALDQVGPFQPVDAPLWDWVIRATAVGIEVTGIGVRPDSTGGDLRLPKLAPDAPGAARSWLRDHLRSATPDRLEVGRLSGPTATALRAGLFLWHDELDECHKLSQSIEGVGDQQLGDVWHAIMHRREPDYSNSKYWFRQIGRHALHRRLAEPARAILRQSRAPDSDTWRNRLLRGDTFDPFAFVDLCEACADDEDSALALTARTIQLAEMTILLQMNES